MKTPLTLFAVLALVAVCASARAAEKWKPLWDGKTLGGWHVIGKGEWKIGDGSLSKQQRRGGVGFQEVSLVD